MANISIVPDSGAGVAAGSTAVRRDGDHEMIRVLITEGFFDAPVSSRDVVRRIRERFGVRWATGRVQIYMKKFLVAGVLHAVKPAGTDKNFWVRASVQRSAALQMIGKSQRVREIENQLFSEALSRRIEPVLGNELQQLRGNFGRNGDCAAFLLRKMLEKLMIIVFGKVHRESVLEDPAKPGGWKGLKEMIELAGKQKIDGVPLLTGKTANEIKGIKFLGDTAAHNPLVNVQMETIVPQMPYIITAYEELAARL